MQNSQTDVWSILFWVLIALMFFTPLNERIQLTYRMLEIQSYLKQLESYLTRADRVFEEEARRYGCSEEKAKKALKSIKGFFLIEPVSMDPVGIIKRLEHLLKTQEDRVDDFIREVAVNASEAERSNMKNVLAANLALDIIYRVVRHIFLLAKKTKNYFYMVQLYMYLPEIMRIARSYFRALIPLKEGIPIGDSLGPLVAFKLGNGSKWREVAKNVIAYEREASGRKLIIIKAKGPGGEVGKPGDAVEKIVKEHDGKVKMIIMVDAAVKLEGERTGEVAEGIGAAIGDPGPEKYKIETVATEYGIPLVAIVVKEDITEAITAMPREVAEAADRVVERILDIIKKKTSEGDVVIIAGIGNTIGISQ
ncbi:MAG: DUF1512 domain-containing protein [Thermoproteota archaeon]|nr:MAG: DUF1512 domain-containing protein [Candidatus Korarchaeota archaeon]